ncbi:MAG: AraC family transcriptional regulator [Litorimonas sp.]
MLELALASITFGQCVLAATLLMMRGVRTHAYVPLALFFSIYAVTLSSTLALHLNPSLEMPLIATSLAVVLLMWPMLWFYLEAMTAQSIWRFRRRHLVHVAPVSLGVICAAMMAGLPEFTRNALFIDDQTVELTVQAALTMLMVILIIIVWLVQAAAYLILGLRRLVRYRRTLKDVFASTEKREMSWLIPVFIALGVTWAFEFVDLSSDSVFIPGHIEEVLNLSLVFTLAVWGSRQTPGFDQAYLACDPDMLTKFGYGAESPIPQEAFSTNQKKYEKSALTEDQARRICGKLERLMQVEHPYLDPDLSLPRLAQRLSVSRNILSQTLNETLNRSFFEYVNSYRIKASLPHLTEGTNSILTIAMDVGFNSRSAFYKAFKAETGLTPSAFRNLLQSDPNTAPTETI